VCRGGQAAGGKKPAKPVGPKVANGKPLAFAPGTLQVSINNSGAAKVRVKTMTHDDGKLVTASPM
jgi:hypothetical protein